jgi:hypothetical protein
MTAGYSRERFLVHQKAFDDLSGNAEQTVQQTMKQAQGAMDSYFDLLQKSMANTPWGQTDLITKWKNYTEKNMAATSACIHKMSRANDFQDIVKIQTEFMQAQMASFAEQMTDLSQAFTQTVAGALKPPSVS